MHFNLSITNVSKVIRRWWHGVICFIFNKLMKMSVWPSHSSLNNPVQIKCLRINLDSAPNLFQIGTLQNKVAVPCRRPHHLLALFFVWCRLRLRSANFCSGGLLLGGSAVKPTGSWNDPVGWQLIRHMAAGQLKVSAPHTYGVGLESGARSSPDSSGSPQQADAVAF